MTKQAIIVLIALLSCLNGLLAGTCAPSAMAPDDAAVISDVESSAAQIPFDDLISGPGVFSMKLDNTESKRQSVSHLFPRWNAAINFSARHILTGKPVTGIMQASRKYLIHCVFII